MKGFVTGIILLIQSVSLFGQQATLKGIVTDSNKNPLPGVSVLYETTGTTTDTRGYYELQIPAGKDIVLLFKYLGYENVYRSVRLENRQVKNLPVILKEKVERIDEVKVVSHRQKAQGITGVKIETVKNLPSTNASVESTLKVVGLGTSSDNELSTQYKVRGGNYDENLVYVNGIEVYRPFLVRSGQQEGLSFVNVDMTQNVRFSSGGFQAQYGDKMSSVLNITYKKPTQFGLISEMSLLGVNTTIEGISTNAKHTGILGIRYRNNRLLVNSKDISAAYNPSFLDIQAYTTHVLNQKFDLDLLGSFSTNNYRYKPYTRTTNFGTLLDPKVLSVYYEGNEKDLYFTGFGAASLKYKLSETWHFNLTGSAFNTQEEEFYDVYSAYADGVANFDSNDDNYDEAELQYQSAQLDHARNELDALIGNLSLKAHYKYRSNHWDFGIKYQRENIKDRLIEWQILDSAGYSVHPPGHTPNHQPYEPYTEDIVPYKSLHATHITDIERFMGFAQWNRKTYFGEHQLWSSIGVRGQEWSIEEKRQYTFSPRLQFAVKPDWERDILFRISGGSYVQPPFYRELRNMQGELNTGVKAQKSWHLVLGSDFSFKMWNRPFKMTTEAYYKYMTDVNPYTLDNVRIRYFALNNAVAYAEGFDMRINGEFVPGTESWFNFGYLKTEENIDGRGYISRPSDQRLKFSLLYQDYVPSMPQLKMYMNLVYNTGVPGGSPAYADKYDYQNRLDDYKRADIGIFYIFKDAQKQTHLQWLKSFKEFSIGGEIFNMFDIQNAITNTWIRNVYSNRMYAVKNGMTGRVFNLKIKCKL